jgi:hypothetical protein
MQKSYNDSFLQYFNIREKNCTFKNDINEVAVKAEAVRILKYVVLFVLIFTITDCASSKKNSFASKRKESSRVNASQLGRNKYYFSSGYQKKLSKSYKKR